ncbi:MAG: hypothetical protein JXB62_19050 [Pirellulales bacterium]|nr:hypothetical protein [Pirellulales bacterium]
MFTIMQHASTDGAITWTRLRTLDGLSADGRLRSPGDILDGRAGLGDEKRPEKHWHRLQKVQSKKKLRKRKAAK